ncbi:ACT domain-containing protein [Arsukibacterium sp.]|uniref:ACT domain-containing protein n=1 Tax=Arsukibacterium sp. TaxID=1977258 RepID=UPI002FDA617F
MTPESTMTVIGDSQFYLEPDCYYYAKAAAVGQPALHRMIYRDDKEITVVTTEQGLADLVLLDRNPEQWRLFVIDCANPFYCVGFLANIASVMAEASIDILLISFFSRDLVFVQQHQVQQAAALLQHIGFVPRAL